MIWHNRYSTEWVRHYALLPTSLLDGRTIWLAPYEERFVPPEDPPLGFGYRERRPVVEGQR